MQTATDETLVRIAVRGDWLTGHTHHVLTYARAARAEWLRRCRERGAFQD